MCATEILKTFQMKMMTKSVFKCIFQQTVLSPTVQCVLQIICFLLRKHRHNDVDLHGNQDKENLGLTSFKQEPA